MAKQVKGISQLNAAVIRLQNLAVDVRERDSIDYEWFMNETTISYHQTDESQAFLAHLNEVDSLLFNIEKIVPMNLDSL